MLSFKVVIVLAACLSWSYCSNYYCSLCPDHTMCKYSNIGPECQESGEGGVSESDKSEILGAHNWLRRVVASGRETRGVSGGQPKAANLRKMVWDNNLAEVAQRWANQCHFGHDTCRKDPRWAVGQNVHWRSQYPNHPVNWTNAILSWYDEVNHFNPRDIEVYRFVPTTGHYTQMLWHDSYAVGCGRKDYGHEKLYVCNYGPAGNMLGDPMYIIGEPCSRCPKGTVCDDLLCAAPSTASQTYKTQNSLDQRAPESQLARGKSNPKKEKDSKTSKEGTSVSSEGKSESPKQKSNTTNGEDDKDFVLDEETKNEINNIRAEIEKLLREFLKKCRNQKGKGRDTPLTLHECLLSNSFREGLVTRSASFASEFN